MPIIVRRREVQRAGYSQKTGHSPTKITLTQNPPNRWRWYGDDGHYYSVERNSKTTAIGDATSGLLKKI